MSEAKLLRREIPRRRPRNKAATQRRRLKRREPVPPPNPHRPRPRTAPAEDHACAPAIRRDLARFGQLDHVQRRGSLGRPRSLLDATGTGHD